MSDSPKPENLSKDRAAEPQLDRALDPELVSVITPVFNSELFIEETIHSVQAQTYSQWEMLILIDDGTRDRTAELVEKACSGDPRIRLVHVPGGRSVSEARNYGFSVARGRYIAFLDADDLWLPTKLDKQLKLMKTTQTPLCYTGFRRLSLDGSTIGRRIEVKTSLTYDDLLKTNSIGCLTAVVDQQQTGPLHMASDIHEDLGLWLKILKAGAIARGVNEDLARYRIVPGSRSSRKLLMANWRWRLYREQERLSISRSLYYYAWYALLTAAKHLRF